MPSPSEAEYDAIDPALSSTGDGEDGEGEGMSDGEFLNLLKQAESQATKLLTEQQTRWQRSYRSLRNEHSSNSKYLSETWSKRSKLFVPRTRAAMDKLMVAAASALFSTQDVVNVEAEDDSDPMMRAGASMMQELINIRLDRATGKTSIPWFQTALGARHDAASTGICCSYQRWLYEAEEVPLGPDEVPEIDPMTGMPMMTRQKVIVNRPDSCLIPPEHVMISPGADWHRVAQSSPYVIIKWPMYAQDIVRMVNPSNGRTVRWREVNEEQILAAASGSLQTETTGVRSAREGRDRYNDPSAGEDEWRILWPRLVFMRVEGVDYTFWSLGTSLLLSDPQPVEEVYPEQGGERPVVIGTDRVEPHKLYPLSFVEGLTPLQQEINDLRNLRLDAVKMATYPPKSVIRGRNVDFKQLAQYGPDTKWLVQNHEDVQERQSPGPHPSSFNEMDRLNVDFDDTAGLFNAGTVQTNRNLNETVGGMRMIGQNAMAASEFSLRVWVETWVEPVLGQLIRMESYFEDDVNILRLAGERAEVFPRFGMTVDLDQMLMQQLLVRVNVGIGSVNPADKLNKFAQAAMMTGQILGPEFQKGTVRVNPSEIVAEIWGAAGYKDAADRFIIIQEQDPNNPQGGQQQEDPRIAEAKAKLEMDRERMGAEIEMQREKMMGELDIKRQEVGMRQQTAVEIAKIDAVAKVRTSRDQVMGQMGSPGTALAAPPAPGGMPMEGEAPMSPEGMDPGPSMLDVMSQQIAAQGQQITMAVQAIAMVAQQMAQAAEAIQGATQVMAQPKTVIRDQTGRITGVTMQ